MIRRAWLAVSIIWSAFWVFLYVIGTGGLSPTELQTQRANTTVAMAVPWLVGWLIRWITTGR